MGQDFVGSMQQGKIYYNEKSYLNAYDQFVQAFYLSKSDIEKKDAETMKYTSLKSLQKQFKEMELTINLNQTELKTTRYVIETLYFYDNRIALAYKDNKFGFIDRNGNTIISFIYDEAGPFDAFSGFAEVNRNSTQYLIDTLGNEYPLATSTVAINGGTVALDLRNQQLSSIPAQVYNCYNLKVLLLGNNLIKSFPEDISKLKNLLFLDLSNNKIQNLPEDFGSLSKLKFLSLTGNQLGTLPESFSQLQSLEELKLNDNDLFILPAGIGDLQKLNSLFLNDNKLKNIPASLCKLYQLKTLSAQKNEISLIAPEIGNLNSIETLILNDNSIIDLPQSMERLKNLTKLYFPVELKKMTWLKEFDLRGNRIPEDKKGMIKSWFPGCNIQI
jgi:Leucine-rich repeat (LRR) protein